MGTQIHIEQKDLEAAGWTCTVDTENITVYNYDLDQDETEEHHYLVAEKDGVKFYSYVDDALILDCNSWGSSIHRIKAAGLFDLPHNLG